MKRLRLKRLFKHRPIKVHKKLKPFVQQGLKWNRLKGLEKEDWSALVLPVVLALGLQVWMVVVTNWFEPKEPESYLPVDSKLAEMTEDVVRSKPKPTREELEVMFSAYGNYYGVNKNMLDYLARCESSFIPSALSRSGKYGGLYQFDERTWVGVRKRMGLDPNPALRFDAEEAVKTTAFKIKTDGNANAWPHCSRVFLTKI